MMNRLIAPSLLALAALVASCGAPGTVPTDGPVGRTVERVVERHDAYVQADEGLTDAARGAALVESAEALALAAPKEPVDAEMAADAWEPVMDRHDSYVEGDEALSDLQRSIYLGSTERLRSLIATAAGD